jgi:hypothetical protein
VLEAKAESIVARIATTAKNLEGTDMLCSVVVVVVVVVLCVNDLQG